MSLFSRWRKSDGKVRIKHNNKSILMETAFKIRASFDSQKLLEDLLRKHKLDVGCTGGITVRNNRYSIDIYASKKEVNKLRKEIIDKDYQKEYL
jgi:hypothetical protein